MVAAYTKIYKLVGLIKCKFAAIIAVNLRNYKPFRIVCVIIDDVALTIMKFT
jgi:hypothetical protein